jgi:toxin FitB
VRPFIAIDTSVAIPLLIATHAAHAIVTDWWAGRRLALAGHAFIETYAVLTRLPHDLRLAPADAARLMASRFSQPLLMLDDTAREVPSVLSRLAISGGATYDALVALAAAEHDTTLATRDARARATYERVGVRVEIVDGSAR